MVGTPWARRACIVLAMGTCASSALDAVLPASARAPPLGRTPRVVVGELFRDLYTYVPRKVKPHSAVTAASRCALDDVARRRISAPWIREADLATHALPSMEELKHTLLAPGVVFNESRRRCAGDELVMSSTQGPPSFCVHPLHTDANLFDQYGLEVMMLSRWLQGAPVCAEPAGSCGADIVIVPSLSFHSYVAVGRSWDWDWCFMSTHIHYFWRLVASRYYTPGVHTPLVVLAEPYSWDTKAMVKQQLAMHDLLPRGFLSRMVIATTISNQAKAVREKLFPPGWRDGAELEQRRREAIVRRALGGSAPQPSASSSSPFSSSPSLAASPSDLPIAAHRGLTPAAPPIPEWGGPMLVTAPVPIGITSAVDWMQPSGGYSGSPARTRKIAVLWRASLERTGKKKFGRQVIRTRMAQALLDFGANCTAERDRCVICMPGVSSCGEDTRVFAEAAESVLCVEPPGDVLGRSHTYLAIQSGCIPALVEGGHLAYDEKPTWWAWRAPDGEHLVNSSGGLLDYTAFSIRIDEEQVLTSRDKDDLAMEELLNVADDQWVVELMRVARDAQRIERMRGALAGVAQAFNFAPTDCGGPHCDAFAFFREQVVRAWRTSSLLPSAMDRGLPKIHLRPVARQ
jgi:hypothetical protein